MTARKTDVESTPSADGQALPASAGSAWLPIDSAPKDDRILAPMRGRVTIARWNDQKYHTKPKPFWESVDSFGILSDRENQPTHWMPLPSLPNTNDMPPEERG